MSPFHVELLGQKETSTHTIEHRKFRISIPDVLKDPVISKEFSGKFSFEFSLKVNTHVTICILNEK